LTSDRPDLNLASNLFGPLDGDVRARLVAAIENPCEMTWDNAYSIILNRETWTTLWQAVIAIDPAFSTVQAPVTRWNEHADAMGEHSETVSGWSRTPTAETIRQAIAYATH
jgi:hypothetical protein